MDNSMSSILTSIKKLVGGISESDTSFDPDIVMDINTSFSILTQLGVGPITGFSIEDKSSVWTDFITDMKKFEMIKSFIHLNVKLLFDPPISSAVLDVINRQISELTWRLANPIDETEEVI